MNQGARPHTDLALLLVMLALTWAVSADIRAAEILACSETFLQSDVFAAVGGVELGHVVTTEPINLVHTPGEACPSDGDSHDICRNPLANTPQGVLLKRAQSWVCVAVPGRHPLDVLVGWLPVQKWSADNLDAPMKKLPWSGVWQNQHAKLNITEADGKVRIDGHAIWGRPENPHFGNLNFEGDQELNALVYNDSNCKAAFRRIGSFVFGQDNGYCGGGNISFSGLYRFRRPLN